MTRPGPRQCGSALDIPAVKKSTSVPRARLASVSNRLRTLLFTARRTRVDVSAAANAARAACWVSRCARRALAWSRSLSMSRALALEVNVDGILGMAPVSSWTGA
jgi:hypothetical protein